MTPITTTLLLVASAAAFAPIAAVIYVVIINAFGVFLPKSDVGSKGLIIHALISGAVITLLSFWLTSEWNDVTLVIFSTVTVFAAGGALLQLSRYLTNTLDIQQSKPPRVK